MLKLPKPFADIPYYRLGFEHASPIHLLPNLTQSFNTFDTDKTPSVQIWAKRDDQAGPLASYGNKYRKFEYIVPDILSQSKKQESPITTLVSEGGIQSNHTVQVAGLARVLGLECVLMLHKGIGGLRASTNPESFVRTGNVQACSLLGAQVRITDENDTGGRDGPLLPVLDELKYAGKVPYWIPPGASLHDLGGLGYARCAFEIEQQEQSMAGYQLSASGRFDYIFVACGSGSSLAGLIAGFRLLEKNTSTTASRPKRRIIGIIISPTKPKSYHEERVLRIARNTARLIGLDPEKDILPEDVRLDDRFAGTGYGILDPETKATLNTVSRDEAVFLDPVYTAKVMRGTLINVSEGSIQADYVSKLKSLDQIGSSPSPNLNALFIHTGGQTSLSAYADVMEFGS